MNHSTRVGENSTQTLFTSDNLNGGMAVSGRNHFGDDLDVRKTRSTNRRQLIGLEQCLVSMVVLSQRRRLSCLLQRTTKISTGKIKSVRDVEGLCGSAL